MARSRRQLLNQAALQSLVKYGPQLHALEQLTSTARENYGRSVGTADASAAGVQQQVKAQLPQVASMFDQADSREAALPGVFPEAAPVGEIAGFLHDARAGEARQAASRLNFAKASALTDLTNRGLQAAAGAAVAHRVAGQTLASDLDKIGQERLSLLNESGTATSSTLQDLIAEQNKETFDTTQKAADRATRLLTAGVDSTGQVIPGGKADKKATGRAGATILPNGMKLRSTSEHATVTKAIKSAQDAYGGFLAHGKESGVPRGRLDTALKSGYPGGTVHDANGKPVLDENGVAKKAPTLKPVPALVRGILLDVALDGHISHVHRAQLQAQGLSTREIVKQLGLPPSAAVSPPKRRTSGYTPAPGA